MANTLDSVFLGVRADMSGFNRDISKGLQDATRNIPSFSPKVDEKGFRQPLGRIRGDLSEFNKSMDAASARVFAFSGTVAIIGSVSKAFTNMLSQTVKVEESLANINVLLNASSKELEGFGNQLFKIAKETQNSFATVSEAAAEFSRQGLSMEETLKRTNDALILTRLSGLNAVKAVEALTAAVNGFSRAGITTTEVLDRFAAVDAAFAVSSQDLAEALSRAGSSAQDAGVSFNELLGLVTSVQQQTARGGPVIGNALKSIFTRLQRSTTIDQLRDLGVQIDETQTGVEKLKALSDALNNVASEGTASKIKELAGGVFQINVVSAALNDLGREYSLFSNALDVASKAQGDAIRRNEELNKTLQTLLNQTSLSVDELAASLGKIGIGDSLKSIVSSFDFVVNGINNILNGESIGSDFARSIVKGIGDVLTGPVLIGAVAAITKLFIQTAKFGVSAIKDLLGMNKEAERQASVQKIIADILQTQNGIYGDIISKARNQTEQEEIVLSIIKEQVNAKKQLEAVSKRLAGSNAFRGVSVDPKTGLSVSSRPIKNAASGMNQDSFVNAFLSERKDIRRGVGGAGSSAKPVLIKDFNYGNGERGPLVANSQEYIIRGRGGQPDAVLTKDMIRSMGGISNVKKMGGKNVENAASGKIPLTNFEDSQVLNAIKDLSKNIVQLSRNLAKESTIYSPPINSPVIQVQKMEKAFEQYNNSVLEAERDLDVAYKNYNAAVKNTNILDAHDKSGAKIDKASSDLEASLKKVNFQKVLENELISKGNIDEAFKSILEGRETLLQKRSSEISDDIFNARNTIKEAEKYIEKAIRNKPKSDLDDDKDFRNYKEVLRKEKNKLQKALEGTGLEEEAKKIFENSKKTSEAFSQINDILEKNVSPLRKNLEATVDSLSPSQRARMEQRAAGQRMVIPQLHDISERRSFLGFRRRRELRTLREEVETNPALSHYERRGAVTMIDQALRDSSVKRTASNLGKQMANGIRGEVKGFFKGGFGPSIISTLAASPLNSYASNNRGTVGGGIAGVGGGIAAGAGFGFLLGPWGAAVGAVIGGLAGLNKALDPAAGKLQKFSENLEKVNSENTKILNNLAAIAQSQSNISALIESGASPEQLTKAQNELVKFLNQITSSDLRSEALNSLADPQKLSELLARQQSITQAQSESAQLLQSIARADSEAGSIFGIRKGDIRKNTIEDLATQFSNLILNLDADKIKEVEDRFYNLNSESGDLNEALKALGLSAKDSLYIVKALSREGDLKELEVAIKRLIDTRRESSRFSEAIFQYKTSLNELNKLIAQSAKDINDISRLQSIRRGNQDNISQLAFENRFIGRNPQNEIVKAIIEFQNTLRRSQSQFVRGIESNSSELRSSLTKFLTDNREVLSEDVVRVLTSSVLSKNIIDPESISGQLEPLIKELDSKDIQNQIRNILQDNSVKVAELVENTQNQNRLAQENIRLSELRNREIQKQQRANFLGGPEALLERISRSAVIEQEMRSGGIQGQGLLIDKILNERSLELVKIQNQLSNLEVNGERLDIRSFIPDAEASIRRSLERALEDSPLSSFLTNETRSEIVNAQLDEIFRRNELTAKDIASQNASVFGNEIISANNEIKSEVNKVYINTSNILSAIEKRLARREEGRQVEVAKNTRSSVDSLLTAEKNRIEQIVSTNLMVGGINADWLTPRSDRTDQSGEFIKNRFLSYAIKTGQDAGVDIEIANGILDQGLTGSRINKSNIQDVIIKYIEKLLKSGLSDSQITQELENSGVFELFRKDTFQTGLSTLGGNIKLINDQIGKVSNKIDISMQQGEKLEDFMARLDSAKNEALDKELEKAGIKGFLEEVDRAEAELKTFTGRLKNLVKETGTNLFDKFLNNSLVTSISSAWDKANKENERRNYINSFVSSPTNTSDRVVSRQISSRPSRITLGDTPELKRAEETINRISINLDNAFDKDAVLEYATAVETELNKVGLSLENNVELARMFVESLNFDGVSITAEDIFPSSVKMARKSRELKDSLTEALNDPFSGISGRNSALLEMSRNLTRLKDIFGKNSVEVKRFKRELEDLGVSIKDLPDIRSFSGFGAGFSSELDRQKQELADTGKIGANVAQQLQDGFADAYTNAIRGAENLGDSLRRLFSNIFADIATQFARSAFNDIFSMIGSSFSGSSGPLKMFGLNEGGYASTVPAMLTGGEYVASPNLVKKYGVDFFERLNNGKMNFQNPINSRGIVTGGSGIRDDRFANIPNGSYVLNKGATRKYGDILRKIHNGQNIEKRFLGGIISSVAGGIGKASSGLGSLFTKGMNFFATDFGTQLLTSTAGAGIGALIGGTEGALLGGALGFGAGHWMNNRGGVDAATQQGGLLSGAKTGIQHELSHVAEAASEENKSRFMSKLLGAGALTGLSALLGDRGSNNNKKNRGPQNGAIVTEYPDGSIEVSSTLGGNLSNIRGKIAGFNNGGLVSGAGSLSYRDEALNNIRKQGFNRPVQPLVSQGNSISDSVPALLKKNEYVIKDDAVDYFGIDLLNAINGKNDRAVYESFNVKRFEDGGLVGGSINPSEISSSNSSTSNVNINFTFNINKEGGTSIDSSIEGNSRGDDEQFKRLANRLKPMIESVVNSELRSGGKIDKKVRGQSI